tara:strand:- start:14817 stop:16007 length:1191 start_codon:yes stop_codon:yes gene_type:complete
MGKRKKRTARRHVSRKCKYPEVHYDWLKKHDKEMRRVLTTLEHTHSYDTDKFSMSPQKAFTLLRNNIYSDDNLVHGLERELSILYMATGCQAFFLNPIIQEMFSHTDAGKVKREHIENLPYPCFYVNISGSKRYLTRLESTYEIKGFYVTQYQKDTPEVALLLSMHVVDIKRPHISCSPYALINLAAAFENHDNIESYLHEIYAKKEESWAHDRNACTPEEQRYLDSLDPQNEVASMFYIYRIFAGLITYLNTENPSLRKDTNAKDHYQKHVHRAHKHKNTKHAARYYTALSLASPANITHVGERETHRILKQCGGYNVTRHWRRGHMHTFWTGPLKDANTGNDWSKIPEGVSTETFWKGLRTQIKRWVEPTLVGVQRDDTKGMQTRKYIIKETGT